MSQFNVAVGSRKGLTFTAHRPTVTCVRPCIRDWPGATKPTNDAHHGQLLQRRPPQQTAPTSPTDLVAGAHGVRISSTHLTLPPRHCRQLKLFPKGQHATATITIPVAPRHEQLHSLDPVASFAVPIAPKHQQLRSTLAVSVATRHQHLLALATHCIWGCSRLPRRCALLHRPATSWHCPTVLRRLSKLYHVRLSLRHSL